LLQNIAGALDGNGHIRVAPILITRP